MKKILLISAAALSLAACAGTWNGVKKDTVRNVEKTEAGLEKGYDKTKSGVEKGWDATKEAVKKGGHAVGSGISKTGEKIQEISQ